MSGRSYDSGSTATLHTLLRGPCAVVAVALLSGRILLEQRSSAEDPHAVVVRFRGEFDRGVYERGIVIGVTDWCEVPPDVAAGFAHASVPRGHRRTRRGGMPRAARSGSGFAQDPLPSPPGNHDASSY